MKELKKNFKIKIIFFLLFFFFLQSDQVFAGRCSGSSGCSACSSCNYCQHCNSGGSCGVCGGGNSLGFGKWLVVGLVILIGISVFGDNNKKR